MGTGDGGGILAMTGPLAVWGSVVLAVIALIIGVTVVPRMIRRRPPVAGALIQAVALVVCAALLLVAFGLVLNRQFVFFGSWQDLVGGGDAVSAARYGGADGTAGSAGPTAAELSALLAAQSAPVHGLARTPLRDPTLARATRSDQGQYVAVTIDGPVSHHSQQVLIHLPAGYLSHPDARYPVLMAYSGIPGSPQTWARGFRIGERLHEQAQRGELVEPIVVMPVVYPGSHDTECVDAADGMGKVETWLSRDVPAWVRTHLRPVESPWAWATIGYSAGGWCASMLSVRHPEMARASMSLGGYFTVDYAATQVRTRPDDPRYDLPPLVASRTPRVAMYFFAGGEDRLAGPSLARMEKAVTDPTGLTVELTERGGHLVPLWVEHLDSALRWLPRSAPGFDPSARTEAASSTSP